LEQVAQHSTENDCWIVVDNKVYDVTKFLHEHPGGKRILMKVAGQDATQQFHSLHAPEILPRYDPILQIGVVSGSPAEANSNQQASSSGDYGTTDVPYAEPYWYYSDFRSPFYTQSHRDFRVKVRNFIESEVVPNIDKWEAEMDYPRELHEIAYRAGVFGACWPEEYGGTPPAGGFDSFHDLIFWDELARCGGGWLAACFLTINIALPPILAVGSDYLRQKVAPPTISGKKIIALCITEPYAGSDVANIKTTARREGNHWVVNGEKKFITSGMKADFFTVAVRTGGPGMGGVSLLLLERDMPGITTRKMPTQGWSSSNTAYVTFDNVRVPVENLIGAENQGFLAIMLNFNHERFAGIAMSVRGARMCVEEAIKYARVRQTFNKRLIDHQVIRHKIAEMVRRVESSHAWLEQVAYQMNNQVDPRALGGITALLKVQTTTVLEYCAREASQILGGVSCIRGGIGAKVERIYRDVRIAAIGGGSEEVMRDLAMRQARL